MRSWAVSTVRELGTLDWDEYDQIEDVMDWLLNTINFDLFSMRPLTAGTHGLFWKKIVWKLG